MNLALAQMIDPEFASLTKELIVMGGSIHPITDDPEFATTPRREFNFWLDPESSYKVFHSPWPRIVVTTVDISVKTNMDKNLIAQIGKKRHARCPVRSQVRTNRLPVGRAGCRSIARSEHHHEDHQPLHGHFGGSRPELWRHSLFWMPGSQPGLGEQQVVIQEDLDKDKFYSEFVELMTRPTPGAK